MRVEGHMLKERKRVLGRNIYALGTQKQVYPHIKEETLNESLKREKKRKRDLWVRTVLFATLGTVRSVDFGEYICFTEELNSQEGTK